MVSIIGLRASRSISAPLQWHQGFNNGLRASKIGIISRIYFEQPRINLYATILNICSKWDAQLHNKPPRLYKRPPCLYNGLRASTTASVPLRRPQRLIKGISAFYNGIGASTNGINASTNGMKASANGINASTYGIHASTTVSAPLQMAFASQEWHHLLRSVITFSGMASPSQECYHLLRNDITFSRLSSPSQQRSQRLKKDFHLYYKNSRHQSHVFILNNLESIFTLHEKQRFSI